VTSPGIAREAPLVDMAVYEGSLRKMRTENHDGQVHYHLNLDGEGVLPLNDLVGESLSMQFDGDIFCVHCGRKTKKSFNGGYCYPCFTTLAECDICIVKPERCHFDQGTCRDEAFGRSHCFQPHTLYLARSSDIKVGLTRRIQQETRWMDQGAVEALEIGVFEDRYNAGLAESEISQEMSDKTNWRKMLTNEISEESFDGYVSLVEDLLDDGLRDYLVDDGKRFSFSYPVQQWPDKVVSKGLDKHPSFTARLYGIKGQYLILDSHVINLRSHAGYHIRFEC
jgi:hypothetical protein